MEPNSADDGRDFQPATSNVLEVAALQNSEVDSEMDDMENLSISSTVPNSALGEANNSSSGPNSGIGRNASETTPSRTVMSSTGNRSNAHVTPLVFERIPLQARYRDSDTPEFPLESVPSSPPQTKRDNVTENPRFVITAWKPVIHWTWKLNDDSCAICKRSLDVICMYCFAEVYESKECRIVTGNCDHAFHEHCLDTWLDRSQTCPIDNSEWTEKLILSHRAYTDYELNCACAFEEDQNDPDMEGTGQESGLSQDDDSSQDHDEDSSEPHNEA